INRSVKNDVAMTGEITLRGAVLPVGGIKEKVLAAKRAGLKKVILPDRNRKDLEDVPENVREGLEFLFIKRVDEIIDLAIEPKQQEIVIPPAAEQPPIPGSYAAN
ncbi:MAG TPA: S16 family serine protease, partial [Acidobacteriota bacterium]|nr:S16 family serine protease [Acidobacteriota bacterium]